MTAFNKCADGDFYCNCRPYYKQLLSRMWNLVFGKSAIRVTPAALARCPKKPLTAHTHGCPHACHASEYNPYTFNLVITRLNTTYIHLNLVITKLKGHRDLLVISSIAL